MNQAANYFTRPGVDPRDVLLAECVRMLRLELELLFDSVATWDRTGDELSHAPRPSTLDPEDVEYLRPAMTLIRKIELVQGRSPEAGPWWLNEVLDGRREP